MVKTKFRSAFTIVELIVVISIIAILAGIVTVSYGAWRTSTGTASLKIDLVAAASAMESARTFNNTYPSFIPTSFIQSEGNTVTLTISGTKSYCINGTSTVSGSTSYYIDNITKDGGAIQGTCETRVFGSSPVAVSGATIGLVTAGQATISWTLSDLATSYIAQCSSDPVFIVGINETTVGPSADSAIVSGLPPLSTFFCRVRAINSVGASQWSETLSSTATNAFGSLAVGTSIEGYWTASPQGFLPENGAAVSRTTYADLFAVVGTTYGAGNGSTTFNLPDSRGRAAVNISLADTEFDTIGERPGSKTEALTIAQMPSHTHQVPFFNGDANDYLGGSTATYGISAGWAGRSGAIDMLQPVGGNQAHNNIQPSIVKNTVIKFAPIDTNAATLPEGSSISGYWASAPAGYLLEDGSAVSRTTFAQLFSAIGTTYGTGNGSTTFNLPDSRGLVTVNLNSADSEFDTMGEKQGSKISTLTIAQMPSHTHQFGFLASGDANDYLGGSTAPYGISSGWAWRSGVIELLEPVGGGQSHNEIQPSIVKTAAIKFSSAEGSGSELPAATSLEGYWATAPSGYLPENGSAVSRTTYAQLFSAIGTTYGVGNGSTTFNLPDSRGRVAVNLNPADTEFDTIGERPGSKTEALTIAQMPSHTHQVGFLASGDANDYLGGSGATYGISASWAGRSGAIDLLQPVGGNQAHNNIQPSIVVLFVIKF